MSSNRALWPAEICLYAVDAVAQSLCSNFCSRLVEFYRLVFSSQGLMLKCGGMLSQRSLIIGISAFFEPFFFLRPQKTNCSQMSCSVAFVRAAWGNHSWTAAGNYATANFHNKVQWVALMWVAHMTQGGEATLSRIPSCDWCWEQLELFHAQEVHGLKAQQERQLRQAGHLMTVTEQMHLGRKGSRALLPFGAGRAGREAQSAQFCVV